MLEYGVYINADIEVVITERFMITYRRVKSQNALESCLLEKEGDSAHYSTAAICRSQPVTTIDYPKPNKWAYAFKGVKRKYSNHPTLAAQIGKAALTVQQNGDLLELHFPDGDTYSARKTEAFTMSELHPQPPAIRDDTIGACLKSWPMGCKEEIIGQSGNDSFRGVTIITPKHMYIYQMMPNYIYCRAARYNTCNSGVVFNQNFRQRSGDLSETYMVEDNTIAAQPLPVADDAFGSCQIINYGALMNQHLTERERSALCHRYGLNGVERKSLAEIAALLGVSRSTVSRILKHVLKTMYRVIPKPQDNSIFWSVSSYTDDQIRLDGCQGAIYEWKKPAR